MGELQGKLEVERAWLRCAKSPVDHNHRWQAESRRFCVYCDGVDRVGALKTMAAPALDRQVSGDHDVAVSQIQCQNADNLRGTYRREEFQLRGPRLISSVDDFSTQGVRLWEAGDAEVQFNDVS